MDHTPAARTARRRAEAANMERYKELVQYHLDNIQDVTDDYVRRQTDLAEYLSTIDIDFQDPPDMDHPPPNRSNLLFQVLKKVGQGRKQLMPKDFPIFNTWTVDYLLRLLFRYWKTDGNHPALRRVTDQRGHKRGREEPGQENENEKVESPSACRFYIRISPIKQERLQAILDDFEKKYPNNTPFVQGVRTSLSAVRPDLTVFDKYIGQTISNTPTGRSKDDQRASSNRYKSSRWLHRLEYSNSSNSSGKDTDFVRTLAENVEVENGMEDEVEVEVEDESEVEDEFQDEVEDNNIHDSVEEASSKAGFEVFEFIELARDFHSNSLLPSQVWWSSPALWAIEYCIVLAAAGRSWNSAEGGAVNLSVDHGLDPLIQAVKSYSCPPVLIPASRPEDAEAQEAALKWETFRFQQFREAFIKIEGPSGVINDTALASSIRNAARISCSTMLAKDITRYGANGLGTFFDQTGGSSPKLLEFVIKLSEGHMPDPFKPIGACRYPIWDYWAVTLVHRLLWLADLWTIVGLEKRQPSLIVVFSWKVSYMLTSGAFLLCEEATPLMNRLLKEEVIELAELNDLVFGQYYRKTWKKFDPSRGTLYLESVCRVTAVTYGSSRWAIAVTGLDHGFFKYSPVLQEALFPLYVFTQLLARLIEHRILAKHVAMSMTQPVAEETIREIRSIMDDIGLSAAIRVARSKAIRLVQSFGSLQSLRFSNDIEGRLGKFDLQSNNMKAVRARYLLTLATARGSANSATRELQIDELLEDDMFDLDHDLFPKGTDQWRRLFQSFDEGKLLLLAWRRARLATPAITAHLETARVAANLSKAKIAATRGPWIGYNSDKSLAEIIDVLLDANHVNMDRASYQPRDKGAKAHSMRLLHCERAGCQAPYGIQTEYKRNANHWCRVEDDDVGPTHHIAGKMNDSIMTVERLLFPFELMTSTAWGDPQAIVDSQPEKYATIKEAGIAKAWIRLDTSTFTRRELFKRAQLFYFDTIQDLAESDVQDKDLEEQALALYDWEVLCQQMDDDTFPPQ